MPQVSFAPPSLGLSFLSRLDRLLPSVPPTVQDEDVPPVFRQRFVLSGYRPVGLPWRRYVLGLLQVHNQTVSLWLLLLACLCLLLRFLMFSVLQGGGMLGLQLQDPEGHWLLVDVSSLPLVLHVFSAVSCLSCSTAALLFQSHSEQFQDMLYFLVSVGVAIHLYAVALALCLYSSGATWTQSMLGQVFLPAAAVLSWLSCSSCCYAKLHLWRQQQLRRKLCQVTPVGVAYLLAVSPVANRLAAHSWTNDSALLLHLLQVVLFLLSAIFFSCPVPERFSPGGYDVIGHSQQLFHFLLSLGALAQQEALFRDFLRRRPALVRTWGRERLLLGCTSFPCLTLCCVMTALAMRRRFRSLRLY